MDWGTYLVVGGLHETRNERRVAEGRAFLVEAYLVASVVHGHVSVSDRAGA